MKWLYVVDHPSRDLPSYAWWSTSSGFHSDYDQVALVSMSELDYTTINKTLFDIIVWNYARPNNIHLLKHAARLGIYNIVHDTEGIPYDIQHYFSNLSNSDFSYIHEIWAWGSDQSRILQTRFSLHGIATTVKVTGSIRYSYVNTLPRLHNSTNIALWNTNFPTISPKYSTFTQEFSELVSRKTFSIDQTLDYIRVASESRICATLKCEDLIRMLTHSTLLIRPHPFENSSFYRNCFDSPRVSFSESGDVHSDLDGASFVLHSGCQTALDAFIRGLPSFRFEYSYKNIWSAVSPRLPDNLNLLSDPNFLEMSFLQQKGLFDDLNVSSLLSNLHDCYSYIAAFPGALSPRRKHFAHRLYRLWSNTLIPLKARIKNFASTVFPSAFRFSSTYASSKLSSSDIAAYLLATYSIYPKEYLNCLYVSQASAAYPLPQPVDK
jgi:surface carbohydrate biosynthesis protein